MPVLPSVRQATVRHHHITGELAVQLPGKRPQIQPLATSEQVEGAIQNLSRSGWTVVDDRVRNRVRRVTFERPADESS